jgi:hypothetical protein
MIMSQSQQFDRTSSIYDGDIGNLGYLTLSNRLGIPDPSISQRTFDLESIDPEFLRPVIPLTPYLPYTRWTQLEKGVCSL